jgi:hypothetical protein
VRVKLIRPLFLTFGLFFITAFSSYSYDDGFGSAKKLNSEHFTLYYSPQLDKTVLAQELDVGASERLLVGKSATRGSSGQDVLADMLETLFIQVSDILDIHLYSLQINIKVGRDYNHLNSVYQTLFDANLYNIKSFYVHDLKTIYIQAGSFTREILGHEIGHAIICHYFVVPPPMRVQEVLSGYVEYQLRKK